jgi:hypothetical protein
MTIAVDVYKNGIKLGSGTATAASKTISSYTAAGLAIPRPAGMFRSLPPPATTSAPTMNTRVITDGRHVSHAARPRAILVRRFIYV